MLADPIASQNIGFMAYHDYMFGSVQTGAQWDTYNGTITTSGCPAPCGISVYQRTQNTGAGPMATYAYASTDRSRGQKSQGKNLPIYNTEYNLNWARARTAVRMIRSTLPFGMACMSRTC